jgi:putative SbcD/Mre11-related phosphoesterase
MNDSGNGSAGAASGSPDSDRWFSIRERAAYLPDPGALVLADLHLGRSRTSNVELPLPEREAIASRLADLLEAVEPGTVVLAGDVCHAFGTVPEGVPGALDALRDRVENAGADLVVVRGNHDTSLDSLADPVPEHRLGDGTLVRHGHEEPGADADRYVIGHDHPAIEIEGVRRPCFLWGEGVYRGADVLVLPAFTELAAGTPVNGMRGRDAQSPLLADLGAFRPIVREAEREETLVFPPLDAFRKLL